jgi:hypothetical protein
MPDVTLPSAEQQLGQTGDGKAVKIDRTWLQLLSSMQKEINDLRRRVTELEP